MIGKEISHYKILEELGRGGMGVVYKARDAKLDRFVALKFLPPHLSQDEENKKRFIHEAKAASALNHPNIATIYEIDEAEGQMFIAMEYIEGKALNDIVGDAHVRPLPVDEAVNYAIQIAKGLAKAHAKGIVHRDIKPANILVTEDGVVKIVDFGLAKLAGRTMLTKEGTTLGTVAYMSPEQTQGAKVDHRTDIWALGVVLYEMISGLQPFAGDYEQAVMYSIMNEEPEPLTALRTGVPMELERIVLKMLAKNAGERYQNVQDVLVDLKSLRKTAERGAEKSSATLAGPGRQATPTKRSYFVYGGFSVLILLAFVIGFFLKKGDNSSDVVFEAPGRIGIAVLPFDNVSPNPNDAYFADGMTDEMISKLSKISRFRVIARTSVMAYKGTQKNAAVIGRELKVERLLEGSVRKAGTRLRINVQLVDAETQAQVWSDEYNRQLTDVFAIQDSISLAVVEKLKVELLGAEKAAVAKHGTDNIAAFNLYLQGRFHWNKRTPEGVFASIDYFEKSIAEDSTYALAYAGLADAYIIQGFWAFRPPREVYPQGKAAALKALQLDEQFAEAWTSLAFINTFYDWEWQAAERGFKKALALNPSYAIAHQWYSEHLIIQGRWEEAFTEIGVAQSLDPLSQIITSVKGEWFHYIGEFEKAFEQYNKVLELNPDFAVTYHHRAGAHIAQKRYGLAIADAKKAAELSGNADFAVSTLGTAYAMQGDEAQATAILNDLLKKSKSRYIAAIYIGGIYQGLSEYETALDWYEKAVEDRDGRLWFIWRAGFYKALETNPRFQALIAKAELK